jgi:hypothetical protein
MLKRLSENGVRCDHPADGYTKVADSYTKIVLTIIAVALCVLVLHSPPATVNAQSDAPGAALYVEPGTVAIRSTDGGTVGEGKMIVDLRSGEVWGFPTTSSASPYPIDPSSTKPPVSKPIYLGRFDLSGMSAPH